MTDTKRAALKEKIDTAQARHQSREDATLIERAGEKAIEVKDGFTDFARKHPITTVAGAVAVGVLVSALFRGSPTRKAGAKLGTKAAGLASLGAELAMAYAAQARSAAAEAGRASADRLEDLGDTIGDTARSFRREAGHLSEDAGIKARRIGRDVSRAVRRRAG